MKTLDRPFVRQGLQSPHRSSRLGAKVDAIFLHYTAGGSHEGTVSWFANPASKASAHFVVGRGGEVVQCVGLDERAWHAGRARFEIGGIEVSEAVDRSAIGIEIANYGLLVQGLGVHLLERGRDTIRYDWKKYGEPIQTRLDFIDPKAPDVEGWWEPYKLEQIAAVVDLCRALREEYEIPLHRIVGHEDVAYPLGRKTDPGPLFPWRELMRQLTGAVDISDDVWRLHKTQINDV